ncbi:MAG: chemotaxis protein CheW [Duganella sp.]
MQGDADDIHSTAADPDHPAGSERRSRLRQYQVQLLERMQAARSGAAAGVRELGVVIKGRHCLLELTQIGEIVTAQALAPVPLARDWYLGLANVRGDLTGVIDLARYAGWEDGAGGVAASTGGAGARRFITFSPRLGFNCALLADRVAGLRQASDMRAVDPVGGQPGWSAQQFDDADGQRWTLLDLAQLVREPRFGAIGF